MRGITDWNMEFVRCDHSILRITEFPPELMPYHRNLDCRFGSWCVLDSMNHASRRKKQNYDDQHWNHGPREFDLRASINLRRFALPILGAPPKPKKDVHQQSEYHRKNCCVNGRNEKRQVIDGIRGRRLWFQNAGHRMLRLRRCYTKSRGTRHTEAQNE